MLLRILILKKSSNSFFNSAFECLGQSIKPISSQALKSSFFIFRIIIDIEIEVWINIFTTNHLVKFPPFENFG